MSPFSEADTRAKLIDPAIYARGWTEEHIRREECAGSVYIVDGKPKRARRGRVDYTLRIPVNIGTQPIAVGLIEAKPENLQPGHGLEQAKQYATSKRLNVPFVFTSNGHLFVEYDKFTGITTEPKPLTDFPSPDELRERYEKGMGFSLADEAAKPLLTPYSGGEASRRYYQDAAIRAVLEKVASGGKHALLSLATGAGKTFIATHLLRRIADAGQLKRALFVCDRDELRSQALGAFTGVFGSDAAAVSSNDPAKNARVLIATYQTLNVDTEEADASFLVTNYPENYFSHIVIDECHRSGWGKWSTIFTRNPDAIQIGLTATPRQLEIPKGSKEAQADAEISADNLKHFGEPVYEYTMAQAIEDGYLAACEIRKGRVNLDETGLTFEEVMARKPKDAVTGALLSEADVKERYDKGEFESSILLPDRVKAMCKDFFDYLLDSGGPEQKTVIFCARDRHADDVATCLNNLYVAWCKESGVKSASTYAFKCTAAASGNDMLPDLRGAARHHFIACTVDLLSTGVDVPSLRNVVFFRYLKSPIMFHQMVGRGTRLDPTTGKLMFRLYDYTDVTRLFGKEFITAPPRPSEEGGGGGGEGPPQAIVEGFEVHITDAGRYVLADVDGKAMPVTVEEYKARLAEKLVAEAPTLDTFRSRWVVRDQRNALLTLLVGAGFSPTLVRVLDNRENYDLFDVLAELGYGLNPLTRFDRAAAFSYKHAAWLSGLPPKSAATVKALASQFSRAGTDGLENPNVFQTQEVMNAGGLPALKVLGKPVDVLQETKSRLFAA